MDRIFKRQSTIIKSPDAHPPEESKDEKAEEGKSDGGGVVA